MGRPSTSFRLSWKPPQDQAENSLEWTLDRFEVDNPEGVSLLALSADETWETLPKVAARQHGLLIAGIFLPIVQLERSFSAALWREHIPALCLPPERGVILPALLKDIAIGTVVSLFQDRVQLQDSFHQIAHSALFHQIVLGPSDRPENYGEPDTAFEMHLVPGLVGLLQCEEIAGKNLFHPSDRFTWEFEGKHAFVTDKRPQPRFTRAQLPGEIRAKEAPCPCGEHTQLSLL